MQLIARGCTVGRGGQVAGALAQTHAVGNVGSVCGIGDSNGTGLGAHVVRTDHYALGG